MEEKEKGRKGGKQEIGEEEQCHRWIFGKSSLECYWPSQEYYCHDGKSGPNYGHVCSVA